jgi:PHD/YefM family antitoxin component YafN of YafNO toxin-antitoxin module
MRTVAAREIKRRGIAAVDEAVKEGPVYIIKNDRPAYVIMEGDYYEELLQAQRDAYLAGVNEALADVAEGRIRRGSAQTLIDELGLED